MSLLSCARTLRVVDHDHVRGLDRALVAVPVAHHVHLGPLQPLGLVHVVEADVGCGRERRRLRSKAYNFEDTSACSSPIRTRGDALQHVVELALGDAEDVGRGRGNVPVHVDLEVLAKADQRVPHERDAAALHVSVKGCWCEFGCHRLIVAQNAIAQTCGVELKKETRRFLSRISAAMASTACHVPSLQCAVDDGTCVDWPVREARLGRVRHPYK